MFEHSTGVMLTPVEADLHCTIVYAGKDVPEEKVYAMQCAAYAASLFLPAFSVGVKHFGHFGPFSTQLAAVLEPHPFFRQLRSAFDRWSTSTWTFHPHVTLTQRWEGTFFRFNTIEVWDHGKRFAFPLQ